MYALLWVPRGTAPILHTLVLNIVLYTIGLHVELHVPQKRGKHLRSLGVDDRERRLQRGSIGGCASEGEEEGVNKNWGGIEAAEGE